MKSLADQAFAIAIAGIAILLVFQWAWHVVAAALPTILVGAILYGGYRFFTGRRLY